MNGREPATAETSKAESELVRLFSDVGDWLNFSCSPPGIRYNRLSPELADRTIYVIDVAEGDKIPRKGRPGMMRSDLLVINKIDLASHVGVDLEVMRRYSQRMRGDRPFVLISLRTGEGVDQLLAWARQQLESRPRTS